MGPTQKITPKQLLYLSGYGWRQNQEGKVNIVGGVLPGYDGRQNQEAKLKILGGDLTIYNICNCAITFSIVLTSE